ncbi:MAG: 2-isopropylmalate synthase, partial [Lentisphaeria bacterium]|nr:2-isopropylmalate synthase [Lentisphaeria bacterium]
MMKLKNVLEPNLLRDIFSYDRIPGMKFTTSPVNMHLPEQIWITDTTFRDGQQARPPYTVEEIVE